jgi:DNA-binding winged helix-turn-helix (wHTH) protein/predicted ATPase
VSSDTLIVFPPFRLDVRNEQLWRDNELLTVRPKPFAVLAYLATHPGRLVTAAELRKAVWPNTYVGEGLLRGYIREVRLVLGDDPEHPRFIETIPRRGYRFLPAVTAAPLVLSHQSSVVSEEQDRGSEPQLRTDDWPLTTRLVGRDTELAQLHHWLDKALRGERQVVFVLGEPGIGKTTLVDVFLSGIRGQGSGNGNPAPAAPRSPTPVPWIARGQCIEHYGAGEAYLPVLEALGQLCRQPGGEQIIALLSRYAPTWLVQMPALVSDTELEALQRKVQGATRERMLRELAEAVEALTAEQPLVLVIEDLHWSDYSTLDLLASLAQRRGSARLLLLATYRPADVIMSGHPLKALKQELQVHGQCEDLLLGFLTIAEVTQYLTARFPQQQFPSELGRVIHQSTEGNPLFMVNVVDYWVSHGVLAKTDDQWQLTARVEDLAAGVPESLRQMIEKQLERLTPEERRIVETASVVGGEFATAAVAAGLEEKGEHVEEWCEGLAKREQFVRVRGTETLADGTVMGRYGFLHALYQQVLYERLATVRRIHLHRRIGEWEERASGKRVSEIAAELAVHFERGQNAERAIHYCYEAGQQAQQRFAATEAAQHFRHGLALLAALPESHESQQHELSLLLALGTALWGTDPEVGIVYNRAEALAQKLALPAQRVLSLSGLRRWHILRGEFRLAKEIGEQALVLTQQLNDPVLQVRGAGAMAIVMLHCGELQGAHDNAVSAIALYDTLPSPATFAQYGQDPKVPVLCSKVVTLWLLGYPEQAYQQSLTVLQWANELRSPFGIVIAHCFVTMILQHRHAGRAVHEAAKEGVTIAAAHGSRLWEGIGRTVWGWSLVEQGQTEAGLAQFQQGEALLRAVEGKNFHSYTRALLAEAYGRCQQVEAGLAVVTEALAQIEQSGERFWEAELWRLKGELLLTQEIKRQKSKVKGQKAKGKRP